MGMRIQVIIRLFNNTSFFCDLMLTLITLLCFTLTFIYIVNLMLMPHCKQASGSQLLILYLFGSPLLIIIINTFLHFPLRILKAYCTIVCLNTYLGVYPDKERS